MSKFSLGRYRDDPEQRLALRAALRALHSASYSDQKITDLLNTYRDRGRLPGHSKETTKPISRPSVQRLRTATDAELMGARRETISKLYNFLSCCEELPTDIYSETVRIQSAHELAPLLQAFQMHMGAKDGPLDNRKLKSLAGTFHLIRDAWTSPDAQTFIQCVLHFEWVGDALFYTEQQQFFDTVTGLPVDETDTGIALPFGMNVVLIGRGQSKDLLKFFSIHDFDTFPDGLLPVHAFSGNFIAVYGKGPHPGFRAIARRVEPDTAETKFLLADELDAVTLAHLTS